MSFKRRVYNAQRRYGLLLKNAKRLAYLQTAKMPLQYKKQQIKWVFKHNRDQRARIAERERRFQKALYKYEAEKTRERERENHERLVKEHQERVRERLRENRKWAYKRRIDYLEEHNGDPQEIKRLKAEHTIMDLNLINGGIGFAGDYMYTYDPETKTLTKELV